MRIAKLKLKNVLGFDEFEFKPGEWVQLTGPNGSGKTSILQAIKAVFDCNTHDATLLRAGAERGEIVMELDDGTEFTKTINPESSPLKAKRDGRQLPRPAELLKSLTDRFSANPLEFLTAKKGDRVSLFLQSMPITVDLQKLQQISGVELPKNAEQMHVYQVFECVHDAVFDDRTGTNRAVDEKKKTIKQLNEAMPQNPQGVVGGEDEIEESLRKLDAQKDADLTGVHEKLTAYTTQMNQRITELGNSHDVGIQQFSDSMDAQISELQKKLDELRSEKINEVARLKKLRVDAVSELQEKVKDVTSRADTKRAEIKANHLTARQPFETQLALLRSNRDLAARRTQTEETIKMLEGELQQLENDVKKQNAALDRIDAYKSEVLANLPIPGLEVREGEIYRNGVAFDRLNMAQRIDIAVEIAKLRAGDLGVICVDGIEALDHESFDIFHQKTEGTGLQFFVSRVADTPFQIATDQPTF